MRSLKIVLALALLVLTTSTAWAAFPYSMTYTVSAGDTILADHYNTANNEHINNNIPESIDDYSANATEMQSLRDPYPSSVVSLATSASEEFGGLRHVLQAITQKTYWYEDPPTFMTDATGTDFDFGTNSMTLGGFITFDVAGTSTGSAGTINFGTDTASFWSDGTDLIGTSTGDISLNASGNDHIFQSAGVTNATIDDTGIDIITGNAYMINATSVLNGTTLGSGVTASSLTSVGTLAGLTATGTVDFGAADDLEVPNAAAPTVDTIGQLALDTTVTGYHQGLLTYYGTETNYIISIPTSTLTTTDSHVIAYNATTDEFEMVAQGSGAPDDATYITQTANGTLSNEQAIGSLSSGIMRVATTTGVISALTDSNGILTNISDETGTGVMVFDTAPTFTTSATVTGSGVLDADGLDLDASNALEIGGTAIISDSAGTATLGDIDAIDATTETTLEAAIDALVNLVTTGALNSGSITSGFGNIDNGASSISGGSFDASDGNITNVGDISLDSLTADDAGTMTASSDITFADNMVIRPVVSDYSENMEVIDNADGAMNLDMSIANNFHVTLTGDPTFTVTNAPPAGNLSPSIVHFVQGGASGTSTVSWVNFKWADATPPTIATGVGTETAIAFYGTDTSNWYGFNAGEDLR